MRACFAAGVESGGPCDKVEQQAESLAEIVLRYGLQIVAFDLAYVAFVALVDRSLAPLRGRLAGLREWREVRAANAARRRPVELERRQGFAAALRRRRAWLGRPGRPRPA